MDFGASCSPEVSGDFDRAVALLHHMTYPGAYDAFRAVAERDPACSIAYWGMAMTLFQPLWPTRPGPAELAEGWALVGEARARPAPTRREALFIDAAAAFFDPAGTPDYWTRIERWAEATAALYDAFPDDIEARAFYALSVLAVASRRESPAAEQAKAAAILEGVLRERPRHPGAVHYTIHADDFDGREAEGENAARGYADIAPTNPHALHMPTHIFVRLGEWDDVISWNERAAAAALSQRAGPAGEFVWDEYPHAAEYLEYAYLQKADDGAARTTMDAVRGTADLQPSFKTAFHLASMPARYALETRDWTMAAALPPRSPDFLDWDAFPWPEAVVRAARGIGAARLGDVDAATTSLGHLQELEGRASAGGEAYFATQIRVLALEVEAWIAYAAGDGGAAVRTMREAVALEEATPKHPVTPGATIPARELLGELLAETGDPAAALAEYAASNRRTPGRFNGLLGEARAAAATGDEAAAADAFQRLLAQVAPDATRAGVAEARTYLDAR